MKETLHGKPQQDFLALTARETANLIGSDEVEGTAVYATDGSKIAGEGARLRIPASVFCAGRDRTLLSRPETNTPLDEY